jgi:CxxC motif-containing protein (DUF1111 family)
MPGVTAAAAEEEIPRAGGATTVFRFTTDAFSLPAANLSMRRRTAFFAGNAFFTQPWVQAPSSTTARDGLGPLFNTNTCQSCHLKDGRGRPPEGAAPMISMLVRVSVPAEVAPVAPEHGVAPEPTYGDQIQPRGLVGVQGEAAPVIDWTPVRGKMADGTSFELLRPTLRLEGLGYGPLHPDALLSARVAPALVGMGLLEATPEAAILAHEDPDDADGDGISGRANRVWRIADSESTAHDAAGGQSALGRFGWKAGQPTVRQQVAAAFAGDLGITSRLFPEQPCTAAQRGCQRASSSSRGEPELSDEVLDLVTLYAQVLGVPGRRTPQAAAARSGEALFRKVRCNACHVETYTTAHDAATPELAGQVIHPYTDLLLHDMGDGLADGRPEFAADGREWRTAPLWGIGLVEIVSRHTRFLHDGRARSLEEAILWHGGEGQAARDAYTRLSQVERDQLLFFLKSL